MNIVNPLRLVQSTISAGGKVNLLSNSRVRVYDSEGNTITTINLDDWPEDVQDAIIDYIIPYID